MKSKIKKYKIIVLLGAMLFLSNKLPAEDGTVQTPLKNEADTTVSFLPDSKVSFNNFSSDINSSFSQHYIHTFGIEIRPGYIIPTNIFIRGDNEMKKPIRSALSAHLKYSFHYLPNSYTDRIYGKAYQGIGLAYYTFGDRREIGDPIAFYLFQGARIAQFAPRLSLNYEWNFGASFGWKPYNEQDNPYNRAIGSKTNAYINVNFYLKWALSPLFDLTTGLTLTHFSNGNTKFPNAGLNTAGAKIGIIYNFNSNAHSLSRPSYQPFIPEFPRHISYDLVFFGSWRRKGVIFGEKEVPSPDSYPVCGFNFAPMYNIGYKLRAGISLDGVYDGSANVYTEDYIVGTPQPFFKPPINKQLALGLSGRAEYVMPYFTVGVGIGANVLHKGGDLKGLYQVLALKIEVTRNSFIHIGYNLQNFHTPNYLMLGFGFRFNNKYPKIHH
ncbi:acyloxyacyl hydrolase [Parabacteroides pacaensis]|uniref:acyloxyacyl hydrolase n=1 Tax=Parabacteroides pacaensis TaxID=2086575 RepID=UPI000D104EF2|nr:acyloxyacyl hydrolase [Parabacteroides pacaensis]